MYSKVYNLSYVENNVIKKIELDKIIKNKKINTLEEIDNFTLSFSDEEHLIKVLKMSCLIPNTVNKIYLSSDKKLENNIVQKIEYDGDILLFENDKSHLKIDYVKFIFEIYKEETCKLLKLAKEYLKKYKNAKGMLNKVYSLINYAEIKDETGFMHIGYDEVRELQDGFENFLHTEFYKTLKGKKVVRYSNIRDFVIKEKYVNNELDSDRKHSYLKYNYMLPVINVETKEELKNEFEYDKEEFLTNEDFHKSDKEILNDYKPNFEAYQDGNDWIAPATKKELKESFEGYAKKYSLKPGDGDLY